MDDGNGAVMGLGKCAPCLDRAITSGKPPGLESVPDAVVLVTVVQQFNLGGGQQMAAPCLVAVCLSCRRQQLGMVSKTGLVTA
jgi:uncharacterized membrane protein